VLEKFAFFGKKWVYWKILEIPARALVRGRATVYRKPLQKTNKKKWV
jgi:hypothetical protein